MATNNQLNLGLSGSTGTGNFVGANTPTLITPVLGVATGTSINFGVSALSYYAESQAWTPVITFATPGTFSFAYTTQLGLYSRVGNIVTLWCLIVGTPTLGTASGNLKITGQPFTCNVNMDATGSFLVNSATPTYPTGTTYTSSRIVGGGNTMGAIANGTAVTNSAFNTTHFTSGLVINLEIEIVYLV